MSKPKQFYFRREHGRQFIEDERAFLIHGKKTQSNPGSFGQ